MNPHYNQSYSKQQIEDILDKIKGCVASGRFSISQNEHRLENINFINEYNIRSERQSAILMGINAEDFCHSLQNINPGFEHEVLYVFVPQVPLFTADGEAETVDVYIKFSVLELPSGNRTIVISFHKRNKPIEYLFR